MLTTCINLVNSMLNEKSQTQEATFIKNISQIEKSVEIVSTLVAIWRLEGTRSWRNDG